MSQPSKSKPSWWVTSVLLLVLAAVSPASAAQGQPVAVPIDPVVEEKISGVVKDVIEEPSTTELDVIVVYQSQPMMSDRLKIVRARQCAGQVPVVAVEPAHVRCAALCNGLVDGCRLAAIVWSSSTGN